VDRLFEHGLSVNHFILGLELVDMMRRSAAIGAATGVGELEGMIHDIVGHGAPVASAIAVLLDLFGIDINKATLGKVAWHIVKANSSAFCKALVVTVVGLVGAGHLEGLL